METKQYIPKIYSTVNYIDAEGNVKRAVVTAVQPGENTTLTLMEVNDKSKSHYNVPYSDPNTPIPNTWHNHPLPENAKPKEPEHPAT